MKTASPLRVTIRLRILPTESRSKVRLSSPRAIKAQRTNLPQLGKNSCSRNRPQNTNRNLAVSVGMLRPIDKLALVQVEHFEVLHDRLILKHNKKAWDLWHTETLKAT